MIPKDVYVGDKAPDLRVRMADLRQPWELALDKALALFTYVAVILTTLYFSLWLIPEFAVALWRAAK